MAKHGNGKAWHGMAREDKTRHGMARHKLGCGGVLRSEEGVKERTEWE